MPRNPKCKSSENKEKLLIGTNEIVDVKMEEIPKHFYTCTKTIRIKSIKGD